MQWVGTGWFESVETFLFFFAFFGMCKGTYNFSHMRIGGVVLQLEDPAFEFFCGVKFQDFGSAPDNPSETCVYL
jgi:hypothetical protein